MNDNKPLSFCELNVKQPSRAVDSKGNHIMRYELIIYLQKIADGASPKTWRYDDDARVHR